MADVEDLDDTRIAHACEQPRLALEALHPGVVLGPPGLDYLHCHRPRQAPVEAPVHAPERSLSEDGVQLVAPIERAAREVGGTQHSRDYHRTRW